MRVLLPYFPASFSSYENSRRDIVVSDGAPLSAGHEFFHFAKRGFAPPFVGPSIHLSVGGRSVGRSVGGFYGNIEARRWNRAGCNSQQRALSPSSGERREKDGEGRDGERKSESERWRGKRETEGSRELYRPTSLSSSIPATEP